MFERNPDKSIDVTADGAVALVDDFATAGEQEEISTPPMSDKRGYVKSSAGVGDAEPMAASDVAFLAPELVSEAEGPVPVPAPAEGRLGYRFVKRVFDIVFSLCVITVLLVPSIALCIAIRVESPGCPIYSQKRVGRIGRSGEVRTFDMYKFRSMHKDADERLAELAELNEADGPLFKIKDDPRVTRIGKFIRKHSIDELPQFLNCLAGQLSCVGPRPPLPSEVAQYDARAMRRLSVKPGLTGYWQVRGRSDTGFEEMVDLDLKYIVSRPSASTCSAIVSRGTPLTPFSKECAYPRQMSATASSTSLAG